MARRPAASTELRRALGAALAAHREAFPLSQGELGRITHYSRTSVSHIEAGRQFPGRDFWRTADRALNANGELLAHFERVCEQEKQWKIAELQGGRAPGQAAAPTRRGPGFPGSPPHDDDWQRDDVNRRELLRLITLAGSLLAVPAGAGAIDVDRVRHAVAHPRRLDPAALDNYERLNAGLWRAFSQARAKREVLPLARGQLALVHASLTESQGGAARQRLCALSGDLFQLCGEIFFDGDNYADAAYCYSMAAHASKEAGAFDLWACAMTRHAFISIYERNYANAAPLLAGAAHLAARGDQERPTRHWVAAVRAQTYAGLGELSACQRALDHAEQVTQLAGRFQASGWLRFEGSRLDEERGACYVALRRPDLAEPALAKALRQAVSPRRRGGVLADLAVAAAQRNDVGQLVMHGAAALDTVRQTGSAGYVGRKLADLRTQLVPFLADRHVRCLDDQIRGVTSGPGARW